MRTISDPYDNVRLWLLVEIKDYGNGDPSLLLLQVGDQEQLLEAAIDDLGNIVHTQAVSWEASLAARAEKVKPDVGVFAIVNVLAISSGYVGHNPAYLLTVANAAVEDNGTKALRY